MSYATVEAAQSGTDKPRRKSPKPVNPLQAGILSFCATGNLHRSTTAGLGAIDLPKRFTLYSPLLLLPANFAEQSPQWQIAYSHLNEKAKRDLFESIAAAFSSSGKPVTHIAINAPVLQKKREGESSNENRLRSPFNILLVYGDFGPASIADNADTPTQADFDEAFWVSTRQLANIVQVWAPRWTMFSRGNLSEKARILQRGGRQFIGMTDAELGVPSEQVEVVDMYIGIGYFAFSYLKSGVKRVWGWDLNPWSIEGLKRGCKENGWGCVVVRVSDGGSVVGTSPSEIAQIIAHGDNETNESQCVRCVAFLGDNRWSAKVVHAIRHALATREDGVHLHSSIRHANLGLLPSSQLSWSNAVELLDSTLACWLHIHENVDIKLIDQRAGEIVKRLLAGQNNDRSSQVSCHAVEQVKTYAPRVMHCVFDVEISAEQGSRVAAGTLSIEAGP